MAGYIGARSVTLSTTVASAQDITATDTTPEVTIINNTHEDSDLGREGKVIFKGQQSGGEESTLAEIEANHSGSADDEKGQLVFRTNDGSDGASPTEAMRITSQQRVGIGTNDPSADLEIATSASDLGVELVLDGNKSSSGGVGSVIFNNAGDSVGMIRAAYSASDAADMLFYTQPTGGSNSERMRIDSSGNVLVGKDNTTLSNAGIATFGAGLIEVTRSGSKTMTLNRLSSDGEIINLRKDGTSFGAIGVVGGNNTYIRGDNIGLGIGDDNLYPTNHLGASNDNAVDVGDSSVRFDDVYATNGTIQTSDENEKQNIASLTSAEITAATAISKLFKTFKWKEKVASKGDDARTHTGVIAQQVQTTMSDAGLDASKYAFWCSNTWWETQTEVPAVEADEKKGIEAADAYTRTDTYQTKDEAPEGATEHNRKGIRYPELLSFIGAATEQRLTSIEARLTALEAE